MQSHSLFPSPSKCPQSCFRPGRRLRNRFYVVAPSESLGRDGAVSRKLKYPLLQSEEVPISNQEGCPLWCLYDAPSVSVRIPPPFDYCRLLPILFEMR